MIHFGNCIFLSRLLLVSYDTHYDKFIRILSPPHQFLSRILPRTEASPRVSYTAVFYSTEATPHIPRILRSVD